MSGQIEHGRALLKRMESLEHASKKALVDMEHRISALSDQSEFWASLLVDWGFKLAVLDTDICLTHDTPETLSVEALNAESGPEGCAPQTSRERIEAVNAELEAFCKANNIIV